MLPAASRATTCSGTPLISVVSGQGSWPAQAGGGDQARPSQSRSRPFVSGPASCRGILAAGTGPGAFGAHAETAHRWMLWAVTTGQIRAAAAGLRRLMAVSGVFSGRP